MLTTKELRQLLEDLIEERSSRRMLLLKDRFQHLKPSNPDLLDRLLEMAWDFALEHDPIWYPYDLRIQIKNDIPKLLKQGIKPRDIVRIICEPERELEDHYRYSEEPIPEYARDLINAYDASWPIEERYYFLEVLGDLMDFTYSQNVVTNSRLDDISMREIALVYALNGKIITEESGRVIADEFGWRSKTSGHKLYQYFAEYSRSKEWTAAPNPYTKKRLDNKIHLFESVLNRLSESGKKRALDVLKTLKAKNPDKDSEE